MRQDLTTPLLNNEPAAFLELNDADANHQISLPKAIKEIIKSAIPMGLSYTFSLGIVVLVILMGHLGNDNERKNYLGASSLLASLLNTLNITAIASLFSLGIVTSHKRAQLLKLEDPSSPLVISTRQEISDLLKNGMLLSSVVIAPPMLILAFSKEIMIGLNQDEAVADLVQRYSRYYLISFPALLYRFTFEQIMFGFEKQVPAMLIGLGSFAIGVSIAAPLGLGDDGLPGIAAGFTTEAYLTGIGYGLYLGYRNEFKEFRFFKNFKCGKKDCPQIKSLLKIGGPMAFTIINEVAAFFIINLFAGWLGSDALVTWDFANWLSFFTVILSASTAQVTSQKVSAALGGENYLNARRYAIGGLPASLLLTMPITITLAAAPTLLTDLVANDEIDDQVMSAVKPLLGLMVPISACDSLRYNMIQTSRATNDNVVPSVISTLSIWFGVLMAYLLAFKCDTGIYGVGAGYGIGMLLGALLLFFRWKNNIKLDALALAGKKTDPITSCIERLFRRQAREEEREYLSLPGQELQATI